MFRLGMFLVACALPVLMYGQEMVRYRLTCLPSQIIFLELPVALERQIGRHTVGLTGAFRPQLMKSGTVPGTGAYHLQNYWNFAYNSATAGLLHKYYLNDRHGLHLETQFLLRRWWFDEGHVRYMGDAERYDGLRSEKQEVAILKLLLGKSIIWHRKDAPSRVLEFFAGPSIRQKRVYLTVHEGTAAGMDERDELWLPGLQFGFRYGIGWR